MDKDKAKALELLEEAQVLLDILPGWEEKYGVFPMGAYKAAMRRLEKVKAALNG